MLSDYSLDVFDLSCPLPLLKVKAFLFLLSSGQTLAVRRVHATHIADFENWCQRSGQSLQIKNSVSEDYFDVLIKKN